MWVTVRDGMLLTSLTIHGMTCCEEAEIDTHFPTLDPDVRALLDGPNFVHLCTLMADGSPRRTVVWGATHGEHAIIFTNNPGGLKGRNMARDPRVAITVVVRENPYRAASCAAAWTARDRRGGGRARRMSVKFTGDPFPMRDNTVYLIAPDYSRFAALPFADTRPRRSEPGATAGPSGLTCPVTRLARTAV